MINPSILVTLFEITFGDFHLSCPNALETTINAVKAGSSRIGEFSQFVWSHPGFIDDLQRFSDMVKSLGIMASKRDEYLMVETYLDDGFPGYFMDCTSYVAYALLESYICMAEKAVIFLIIFWTVSKKRESILKILWRC